MADMTTSGMDLRLERVAAHVKIKDLALAMGVHRATLNRYEGLAVVPDGIAWEYRRALTTFRDVARGGTAA